MFDALFSPLEVGPVTLKNRIEFPPHATESFENGLSTPTTLNYFVERAKGGVGFIHLSQLYTKKPTGFILPAWEESPKHFPMIPSPEVVPGLRQLAEGVHAYGAKISMQISGWPFLYGPVSAIPFQSGSNLREITLDNIPKIYEDYAVAARLSRDGGFDGVTIHGTHGSLVENFMSPANNQRNDSYGGTLENRTRFLKELAVVVRGVIGDRMALGMRMCGDQNVDGGITPEYASEVVKEIDGIYDFIMVDQGSVYYQYNVADQVSLQTEPLYMEPGYSVAMTATIKRSAKKTKISHVGRVTDPLLGETIVAKKQADSVGMVRALIADPFLPNKARTGRLDEIRPCIGTVQDCLGRTNRGLPIRCTVNVASGREGSFGPDSIPLAATRKKVLVVGAGPAGLEAARVAAMRGHEVVVYERDHAIGGQVKLGRMLPGRGDVGAIVSWYESELKRLGVRINLRMEVPNDESVVEMLVEQERPDAVVLAIGSSPARKGLQWLTYKEVPGWDRENVHTVDEILSNKRPLEGDVVVADATTFVDGPGIAEWLATHGSKSVVFVIPQQQLTPELVTYNMGIHIYRRLRKAGVRLVTHSWVRRIEKESVVIYDVPLGREEVLHADHMVLVCGRIQNQSLKCAFSRSVKEVYEVGDCDVAGGRMGRAIDTGFMAGIAI